MSVQIVTYQDDHFGVRIPLVKQPLDECGPVRPRPLLFGLGVTPAGQRLGGQKDTARAIADILIVLVANARRLGRIALSCLGEELDRLFVHTYDRAPFVVRPAIHLQNILHRSHESCAMFGRNAPALLQVRLIFVFFRMRPTCV